MSAVLNPPPLLPCNPDNIPEQLRKAKRWAPWAAPWDPVKQKYGKVPHRADRVTSGLSNGSTVGWVSFEQAVAAYRAHPDLFAGIGYLMTDQTEVTGVDLDHCIKDGVIEPWAREVIAELDSYTEVSPSGTGFHIIMAGELKSDWSVKFGEKCDKWPGIDVYGARARFLTFTGAHVDGTPTVLHPRGEAMATLEKRYRKSQEVAKLHVLPLPDTYGLALPDPRDLGLPDAVINFMYEGLGEGTDRSRALIQVGASLAAAGVSPEVAFAMMTSNEHTMEAALGKRQYDDTRAREYLWTHHCRRGAEIVAAEREVMFAELDPPEIDPEEDRQLRELLGEDYDTPVMGRDLAPIGLKKRFQFESLSAFLKRPPPKWIIRGLIPQASLAVIFGESGSGKTFFALDMAVSVSTGGEWRGVPIVAGGVAYVVAEGAGGFIDRASAYCHQHGLSAEQLPLHILADQPNLMQRPDVDDLIASLQSLGPLSMVVLDTYARVMGEGNENEAKDVNKIVRHCARIHKETGAIVVLIHHSGKDISKGARGSGALRAAADAEIEVKKMGGFRTATITKMKDGADDASFKFRLQTVVVGWDGNDEERTSCVVEHILVDEPEPVAEPEPRGKGQRRVLSLMRTYYPDTEVEKEAFVLFAMDHTEGANDPNAKTKIQEAIKGLVKNGFVTEVSGHLRVINHT